MIEEEWPATALADEFGAAMAAFGPLGARPRLAVGVSGGADSTALVLLARNWAAERGGDVLALIVDHGLRPGSNAEAELTRQRLAARGIASPIITLSLVNGAGLQQRARLARHAALAQAARDAGALFLLLGHHAADQAETVAMRAARGDNGLEGIASWSARNNVVILRPLLSVAPDRLRALLRLESMAWTEDPSNQNQRFERNRLRRAGGGAVPQNPAVRQQRETETAGFLARHTIMRPQGFAVILADEAPPPALAALLRTIGGAHHAPRGESVRRLAARLQPATLGGVRLLPAGRLGRGWLLVRELRACAPPMPARCGSVWDGRFRLMENVADGFCGAVGADTPMLRKAINLPAAVLAGLPCIRNPGDGNARPRLAKAVFIPPAPLAALGFSGAVIPGDFKLGAIHLCRDAK